MDNFCPSFKIVKKFCVVSYIVADKKKVISRNVYNDIHIPFGDHIVVRHYIPCNKEPYLQKRLPEILYVKQTEAANLYQTVLCVKQT